VFNRFRVTDESTCLGNIEYTKGLEHGYHAVESYPDSAVWRVNELAMAGPRDGATRGDASTKARIRRAAVFGDGCLLRFKVSQSIGETLSAPKALWNRDTMNQYRHPSR